MGVRPCPGVTTLWWGEKRLPLPPLALSRFLEQPHDGWAAHGVAALMWLPALCKKISSLPLLFAVKSLRSHLFQRSGFSVMSKPVIGSHTEDWVVIYHWIFPNEMFSISVSMFVRWCCQTWLSQDVVYDKQDISDLGCLVVPLTQMTLTRDWEWEALKRPREIK